MAPETFPAPAGAASGQARINGQYANRLISPLPGLKNSSSITLLPRLRTLTGDSGEVTGVAVTPDGKRAVSASDNQTLKVWDLASGKELQTLAGHSQWVTGVAVTPDGKRAVSASQDQTLKVWDLESGTVLATFTCDSPARCCACAGNREIVAGDASGRVHFLQLEL